MTTKVRSWWQYRRKLWIVTIVTALVIMFVLIVYAGYRFSWEWTGFGPETSEPKQHAKTLWDWLNLLGVFAIPAVVGFGAAWYTAQQRKVSEMKNTDNQREMALQAYIDKISELLLENGLGEPSSKDEVRMIARVRTITLLFQLDARRVGYLFTFLREAGLMSGKSTRSIVSLSQADLSKINLSQANLRSADLRGADLSLAHLGEANLSEADLNGANLRGANLRGANLRGADLSFAHLGKADLSGADLRDAHLLPSTPGEAIIRLQTTLVGADLDEASLNGADLRGANLSGASFYKADLRGADFARANLKSATNIAAIEQQAKSLQGAIMPDGSKHH